MSAKVRCNECMQIFDESEIVVDYTTDVEYCPHCNRTGCLMDLEEEE